MNERHVCPDCGKETKAYHQSNGDGTGSTYVVCIDKCMGWKVIAEYRHGFSKREKKYYNNEQIR